MGTFKRCFKWFFAVVAILVSVFAVAQPIPQAAHQYRADLTRNAQFYWGINAPVATFAGQIHQESAWRANAKSPFASGLAQFTPDTAKWIAGAYPRDLAGFETSNPIQSIRALVIYDKHLASRIDAATSCDLMAFALAAYNGGLGWIQRDKMLATAAGDNPRLWFGHVEKHSKRADWAMKENRDYPRKILTRHQRLYSSWGPGIHCASV